MSDAEKRETTREEALRVADRVWAKLRIENGVVRAADLVDALNELLDPHDGTEPGLVLPYPSVAREVVGQIITALRASERAQGASGFISTMEI